MSTGLASESFWEDDYLGDVVLPSRPDPAFQFDRVLSEALASRAAVDPGGTVIEIGCAPATWLGYYAERFKAKVIGIEYTRRGVELSRRNLEALGVPGEIVHGDFFSVPLTPCELVLSLGFIEHFDDLRGTFARHLDFVAPGGRLVLGVPNYRGLMGFLQRKGDPAFLAMHNLAAMDSAFWRQLAGEHGCELVWQGYLDGPDPAILSLRSRWLMPVVVLLELLRAGGLGRRLNHRLVSAYLVTILRRPA